MTIRVFIPWTITWRSLARHDAYWYKGKHMWKMLQIGSIGWLCRLYGAYTKNSKTFTATAQLVGCQRRCHNNNNVYNNLSITFCHARWKRTFCHACIAIALMYPPNRWIFLCSVSPIQDTVNLMSCCSHEEARLSFNGPCCKVLSVEIPTLLISTTCTRHICTWCIRVLYVFVHGHEYKYSPSEFALLSRMSSKIAVMGKIVK